MTGISTCQIIEEQWLLFLIKQEWNFLYGSKIHKHLKGNSCDFKSHCIVFIDLNTGKGTWFPAHASCLVQLPFLYNPGPPT